MYNDKHRELDFWLGSWDVRPRNAPTKPPARSDINSMDE
jgi:hypothetical protein